MKLRIFRNFEPHELEFIKSFKNGEEWAEPGTTMISEGQTSPHLYTLLSGWAFRYKMLPDGRRQILSFLLPGDFIGLQGSVFAEMQHTVEALTKVRLCTFQRQRLWDLFNGYPDLAYDVAWLASRGEGIVDEHLLAVGQRRATERVAYLILHLFERCSTLQMTVGTRMHFPGSQTHLADMLGLSLAHTNKVIRALIKTGAIRWDENIVDVRDEGLLRKIAASDQTDRRPRPLI